AGRSQDRPQTLTHFPSERRGLTSRSYRVLRLCGRLVQNHRRYRERAEEPTDVPAALQTAHALWQASHRWNARIRDYAAQKLLPLKNDVWLDDEEDELTADQFQEKMTLKGITVYPDGAFEFWHDDGDLFWGHSILVSGNLTEGPTDANIPG